jgi:hypothetical protein
MGRHRSLASAQRANGWFGLGGMKSSLDKSISTASADARNETFNSHSKIGSDGLHLAERRH